MSGNFFQLFEDAELVEKIKQKLPTLFYIAQIESSRAGKTGMHVGSLRENIIVALFIYKFGEENVNTEIPITEAEVDVRLFDKPISIKTISNKSLAGVKLIWTVDPQQAEKFMKNYIPTCDIIFIQINWGGEGGLYYVPLEIQTDVFHEMGRELYIKLPKEGTNPRGVEFTKKAIAKLLNSEGVKKIEIFWERPKFNFNPYQRWVDYWRED